LSTSWHHGGADILAQTFSLPVIQVVHRSFPGVHDAAHSI
jgi:hypothetical protein